MMIAFAKKHWIAILTVVVAGALFARHGGDVMNQVIENHRKAEMSEW
ncbi:hypothetical protein [Asticcacaulis sp. W401b]